jgi:hypothetical protein
MPDIDHALELEFDRIIGRCAEVYAALHGDWEIATHEVPAPLYDRLTAHIERQMAESIDYRKETRIEGGGTWLIHGVKLVRATDG